MARLPPLAGLSLAPRGARTGEFYPLSQAEVDELNQDDNVEGITFEPFQLDAEPTEGWHTFRVRDAEPKRDGTYGYKFYRAESLWEWYKRSEGRDPTTRQPAWYEDCVAMHAKFEPDDEMPDWVEHLPRQNETPVQRYQRQVAWLWVAIAPNPDEEDRTPMFPLPPLLPLWWTEHMNAPNAEAVAEHYEETAGAMPRPKMLDSEAQWRDGKDYIFTLQIWLEDHRARLSGMWRRLNELYTTDPPVDVDPAAFGVVAEELQDAGREVEKDHVINEFEWFKWNFERMQEEPFVATLVLPAVEEPMLNEKRMRDAWAKNAYDPRDVPRRRDDHGFFVAQYSWRSLLQIDWTDLYPTLEATGPGNYLKGPLTGDKRERSGPKVRIVRLYIPYLTLQEGMRFLEWLREGLGLDGNEEDDVIRIGYMHLLDLPYKPWVVLRFRPERYPDQDLQNAWSPGGSWLPLEEYLRMPRATRDAIDTSGYPAPPTPWPASDGFDGKWQLKLYMVLVLPYKARFDISAMYDGVANAFGDIYDVHFNHLKSVHIDTYLTMPEPITDGEGDNYVYVGMAPFVASADNGYLDVPLERTYASRVVVIGWEMPDAATAARVDDRAAHLERAWGVEGDEDELWGRILGLETKAHVMKQLSPVPHDVEDSFDLRALATTARAAIRDEIFRELDKPPAYEVEMDLVAGVFPPPPGQEPPPEEPGKGKGKGRGRGRGGGRGRGRGAPNPADEEPFDFVRALEEFDGMVVR